MGEGDSGRERQGAVRLAQIGIFSRPSKLVFAELSELESIDEQSHFRCPLVF